MCKDQLFNHGKVASDFQFTAEVAEVFDDMLARSIPNYQLVIEMSARLLEHFLKPGDHLYDLGCSTGNTLLHLARRLAVTDLHLVGVDNSPAMIDKARRKAAGYAPGGAIKFIEADIDTFNCQHAGAIILNYTMQFIRPPRRPAFAAALYRALRPGGVLIVSEKIISHDAELNRLFIDFYLDFKRSRGYSEIEISRKREALENVLIPFSLPENRQLLTEAGFARVDSFFQWFNFASLVAVKQ